VLPCLPRGGPACGRSTAGNGSPPHGPHLTGPGPGRPRHRPQHRTDAPGRPCTPLRTPGPCTPRALRSRALYSPALHSSVPVLLGMLLGACTRRCPARPSSGAWPRGRPVPAGVRAPSAASYRPAPLPPGPLPGVGGSVDAVTRPRVCPGPSLPRVLAPTGPSPPPGAGTAGCGHGRHGRGVSAPVPDRSCRRV